jgi:putative ABC transport system substrate-binding protein
MIRRVYRIALFSTSMPYHAAVNNGFFAAIEADTDPSVRYVITQRDSRHSNPDVISEVTKELVQHNYDAIVTVGASISRAMAQQLQEEESEVPMIFIGVAEPVQNGCVRDEECPGVLVSGVRSSADSPDMQIRLFHKAIPNIKRLLVITDLEVNQGLLNREANATAAYCKKHKIQMVVRNVVRPGVTYEVIKNDISRVDAVLVPEGAAANGDLHQIVMLCNQYNIALCAGDLKGAEEGAAMAFGPDPEYAGMRGYLRMKQVVKGEIDPATTPIERISNSRKIILNYAVCKKLGIETDPVMVYALDRGAVVREEHNE